LDDSTTYLAEKANDMRYLKPGRRANRCGTARRSVLRGLSGTTRSGTPPKKANAFRWQRSQVPTDRSKTNPTY